MVPLNYKIAVDKKLGVKPTTVPSKTWQQTKLATSLVQDAFHLSSLKTKSPVMAEKITISIVFYPAGLD